MQIKLKNLRFQNWKCYQDQIINFDIDPDLKKNIWVVFGNNGYGKTSLLEAILWCLYGVRAIYPNTRQQPQFVNFFNTIAVEENPNTKMSVALTFQQGTTTYRIVREVERVVRGNSISFKQTIFSFSINGKERPDTKENIESILPESCKEFFFFDGKKIEEYAKLTHNQETRDAIERVLGIPEIRNLVTDSKNAHKQISDKFDKVSHINQDLRDINQQINSIQDEINIEEAKKNNLVQELDKESHILNNLDTEARQSEEIQRKFDEISKLESSKSNLDVKLKNILEKIKNSFKKSPIYLLSDFIKEVSEEMHTKTLLNNKQLADASLIEKLINNELCVCGRCIDTKARQYLKEELEKAKKSQHLYQEALSNQKLYTELSILCRAEIPDLEILSLERDRIQEDIEETKQIIDKLTKDTDSFDRESIKKIWQRFYQQESIVKQKQKDIKNLEKHIDNLQTKEQDLQRQRKKLAAQNKEADKLSKQIDIAKRLYQAADKLVEWRIDESRETIEKHTSKIHQTITNKPEEYKGVKINPDYTLGIEQKSGNIINPEQMNFSAGEKEVLAFAFIAGLNLASGKAAPLIMDTPFGHLDPQHKENIINSLPEIPSQVILLATGEDLPQNILDDLEPNIAQINVISRQGENNFSSVIKVQE